MVARLQPDEFLEHKPNVADAELQIARNEIPGPRTVDDAVVRQHRRVGIGMVDADDNEAVAGEVLGLVGVLRPQPSVAR